MNTAVVIGAHEAWRSGDLLVMRVRGPLTRSDVDDMKKAVREVLQAAGRCFLLADLGQMAGLDPLARRRIAEWSRERDEMVDGVAVIGCNFAMRTLITLTLNAIKLLGEQQTETVFLRDEADALRWIERKRAALPAK